MTTTTLDPDAQAYRAYEGIVEDPAPGQTGIITILLPVNGAESVADELLEVARDFDLVGLTLVHAIKLEDA